MVDPPRQRSLDKADPVSASRLFPWPPAGNFVAVYGQDLMAADMCDVTTVAARSAVGSREGARARPVESLSTRREQLSDIT